MAGISPNQGKNLNIEVNGVTYARLPFKTSIVMKGDDLLGLIGQYLAPSLQPDDLIFISEKVVGITQGRAYPIKDIVPSKLAKFLCRYVTKTPAGIGIGSPWTMELAIREVGALRILFAAFVAGITKPFGLKGMFYHICGRKVSTIDGPCAYTLPPYNEYASLGPAQPNKVARAIKEKFKADAVIVDANDLGVVILGKSDRKLPDAFLCALFRDNPLGQTNEQTPLAIVRKIT